VTPHVRTPTQCNRLAAVFTIVMSSLTVLFLVLFFSNANGQQANVFFLKTADYMMDLYNNVANSASRNFYHLGQIDPMAEEHLYPPLTYWMLYPLSKVSQPQSLEVATAQFFWFVVTALFFLLLYDASRGPKSCKLGVALSMVFSGLFICSFERGNLAVLSALLCGFFIFNYSSNNRLTRELSIAALSIAVALKGFPILLGLLLLFDRRYREAVQCAVYSLIAVLVPFLFVEGGFANIRVWIRNIGLNSTAYEFRGYPRFGFRYFFVYLPDFSPAMPIYLVVKVVAFILIAIAVTTAIFHRVEWKRAAQLVLCIMLYPVNSGVYTGLLLFPVIILFLNCGASTRRDWVYLALVIFILNPVQYTLDSGFSLNIAAVNLAAYTLLVMLTGESLGRAIKRFSFTATESVHT